MVGIYLVKLGVQVNFSPNNQYKFIIFVMWKR
jgi:hypothetical protein